MQDPQNYKVVDPNNPEGLTPEELSARQRIRPVIDLIRSKYQQSKMNRTLTESNWLDSYKATRGEYSNEEMSRMEAADKRNPGASKIFVKVTKTKVQAALGQILELVDDANGFPIDVEPHPTPDGIADIAHVAQGGMPQQQSQVPQQSPYGYAGDGQDIAPGTTTSSLLRGLEKKYTPLLGSSQVVDGTPDNPQQVMLTPAEESAQKLRKIIQGQLADTHAMTALRKTIYEQVMLGTGVLKGVFSYEDTIHRFDQAPDSKEITYNPVAKLVPRISFVSCWNIFPDDAASPERIEWVIERHILSKTELKDLKNEPFFDEKAIIRLCYNPPTFAKEYWENVIIDNTNSITTQEKFEVLEYWGYLDKELVESLGIEIPHTTDLIQVNIWVCGDEVLRAVVNPFVPARIPYYFVPYELHPGLSQIWGVGVPENMKDTQQLMNGHIRMAIDNLRYAGSLVFEVNESQLVPGQDLTIYPGKIFRKQGGAPGQSVYGITFPNTSTAHIQMYDKARQLADEQTFPSYSHGQTGVTGTTRTASGMGMLFSAAQQNIKTVVSNLEYYLLRPLGESYFYWNMQFNEDNIEIRGDYKIIATGTTSLLKKEILTQRLLQFLQIGASSPATAPMLNYQYILKEVARSLGLDSDKVVHDMDKAMLNAAMMQQAGGMQGVAAPAGSSGSSVGGEGSMPSASDNTGTGGGNIGVGSAPQPGQQGFSGNTA